MLAFLTPVRERWFRAVFQGGILWSANADHALLGDVRMWVRSMLALVPRHLELESFAGCFARLDGITGTTIMALR